MKIFALAPGENWIVDRMVAEFSQSQPSHTITTSVYHADVIWLCADWCWRHVPMSILKSKPVVTTIHHIFDRKFDFAAQVDFAARDEITDVYHVCNQHTYDFLKKQTKKEIVLIPYWANQFLWKKNSSKAELRDKYKIPQKAFVIGSFQRDTEGSNDIDTNPQPKLEKGVDILATFIVKVAEQRKLNNEKDPLVIVLAAWRRQYLIQRLKKELDLNHLLKVGSSNSFETSDGCELNSDDLSVMLIHTPPSNGITFSDSQINELYQTLDLYPVTSRCEGGPQALIECGLLGIPVISTAMGIAEQVFPENSQAIAEIAHGKTDEEVAELTAQNLMKCIPAVPDVQHLTLPGAFEPYRKLFEKVANG